MTQEERTEALEWLAQHPEAYECDLEIKLLVPEDQVPPSVLAYIEAQRSTRESFEALNDNKDRLGISDDYQ